MITNADLRAAEDFVDGLEERALPADYRSLDELHEKLKRHLNAVVQAKRERFCDQFQTGSRTTAP